MQRMRRIAILPKPSYATLSGLLMTLPAIDPSSGTIHSDPPIDSCCGYPDGGLPSLPAGRPSPPNREDIQPQLFLDNCWSDEGVSDLDRTDPCGPGRWCHFCAAEKPCISALYTVVHKRIPGVKSLIPAPMQQKHLRCYAMGVLGVVFLQTPAMSTCVSIHAAPRAHQPTPPATIHHVHVSPHLNHLRSVAPSALNNMATRNHACTALLH